jgi:hypothetical protein
MFRVLTTAFLRFVRFVGNSKDCQKIDKMQFCTLCPRCISGYTTLVTCCHKWTPDGLVLLYHPLLPLRWLGTVVTICTTLLAKR